MEYTSANPALTGDSGQTALAQLMEENTTHKNSQTQSCDDKIRSKAHFERRTLADELVDAYDRKNEELEAAYSQKSHEIAEVKQRLQRASQKAKDLLAENGRLSEEASLLKKRLKDQSTANCKVTPAELSKEDQQQQAFDTLAQKLDDLHENNRQMSIKIARLEKEKEQWGKRPQPAEARCEQSAPSTLFAGFLARFRKS